MAIFVQRGLFLAERSVSERIPVRVLDDNDAVTVSDGFQAVFG
tara:strand:- start:66793 stop:66921 length:129 start_codon:yes stop_codon:yes gene_type:complete